MTKICSVCKIEKNIEDFVANKQCKYGRTGKCTLCGNISSKLWRDNNPEKVKIILLKSNKKHPPKYSMRRFRLTLKGKLSAWKSSAIRRNIPWNLKLSDIQKLPLICYYTGYSLSFESNVDNAISLDRLDSSKGYEKSNVVFCRNIVNRMKWKLSESEFIVACKKIAKNYKKSIADPVKYISSNFITYRKLSARLINRKCSANAKGRKFTLDIDEISNRPFNCYYTHVPLTCEPNEINTVSFDRLNSNLGYTPKNTVLCCRYVNLMKQEMTEKEFLNNCKLIVKNTK